MKRILIAPDKFKGCLSASEVAEALARGFQRRYPLAELELLPMADGGEGTASTLCDALGGRWMSCEAHDPLGRPIQAGFVLLPDGSAVLEMAEASGLKRLDREERLPWKSSSFGTGEMILAATRAGATRILVGIGGSATNDGGLGMAAALGFRFLDDRGREVKPVPESFDRIMKMDRRERPDLPSVTGLCDVKNSLLGENGATAVYGPQKGVAPEDILTLDRSLARVVELVADFTGEDFREAEGSGAAGGLGFGLLSFCGAVLEPGFEALARVVSIEEKIRRADLVVTGEGGMDRQTLEGKTAYGVACIARRLGRPVAAFVGRLEDRELLLGSFDQIIPLVGGKVSSEQALREASVLLEAAAGRYHA